MTIYRATSGLWVQADRDAAVSTADCMVSAVADANNFTYVRKGDVTLTAAEWDARTLDAVPTTLSTTDKQADLVLSNGNMTVTHSSANGWRAVRATSGKSAGKWYFEIKNNANGITTGDAMWGFMAAADSLNSYPGNAALSANSMGWQANNTPDSAKFKAGSLGSVAGYGTVAVNGYAYFAIDFDAGKLWVKNSSAAGWAGGGDPTLGTTPTFTFTPGTLLYPTIAAFSTGQQATVNFGATAFNASAPTGFAAWSSALGLVDGEFYFQSSVSGGITRTAPTSGIWQCIGKARSSTVLMFDASMAVDLGASGGGNLVGIAGPLTVAGTTLSLATLNLSADEEYEMTYSLKNNTAVTANVNAFYNGDTTVANYYEQYHYAAGGSNLTGVVNDALALVIDASGVTTGRAQIGPLSVDGKATCDFQSRRGTPTNPGLLRINHGRNVVANLTQLDLVASQSMAPGSYFKVYRKQNTAIAAMPRGAQIGYEESKTTTPDSTALTIPYGAAKPQITDGKQLLTVSYTPRYANSLLVIEGFIDACELSGNNTAMMTLCKVGTSDAIGGGATVPVSAGNIAQLRASTSILAGVAGVEQTFTLRFGPTANTMYVLRTGGFPTWWGGVAMAKILVREIKQ
jgi:hypothetical protein